MPTYDDNEVEEYAAEEVWLYVISSGSFTFRWTNAKSSQTATIDGTPLTFTRPRGGIRHTEPTEGADSPGTGLEIHLSPENALVRKHKSFPPSGNTTVTIYRQNEVGGEARQYWTGIITEVPITEEWEQNTLRREGVLLCSTEQEEISGSEGLIDNFGPVCPWMLGTLPCPVSRSNVTDTAEVVSVTPTTEQVRLTPSVSRVAGWFTGGVLIAPDDDKRHITNDTVTGSDHILTLSRGFPATTLKAGDPVTVIWGDDHLYATCRDKFGTWTGDGAAWGGNNIQANKNIHQIGRYQ